MEIAVTKIATNRLIIGNSKETTSTNEIEKEKDTNIKTNKEQLEEAKDDTRNGK